MNAKQEIIKIIKSISGRFSGYQIFSDWVECSALAISNTCRLHHDKIWQDREDRYIAIMQKYSDDEKTKFAEMLAFLTEAYEEDLNLDPWELETGADLCRDCYKEIDDMVAFMVKNPTIHFDGGKQIGAEQEKPKRNTGHGKLNLDLGKIGALYRTNKWSVKDIASDMHCSEQTIRNHLQETLDYYDKKMAKEDLEEALNNDLQEA